MVSNRVKRNIWLTLSILSIFVIVDRIIRIVMGELDWWQLVSAVIISGFCIKFYLCYRRQVNADNVQ
ncbi:MAG: hypothetical protein K2J48_03430 [Muribaculaceae bacterium]|nr:hypothetical protein [Muribaculaceae bacterium]MDE6792118.1 hypothetical protein [Muribaculaceae bacterium]